MSARPGISPSLMDNTAWLDRPRPRRRWSIRAVVAAFICGDLLGLAGAWIGFWLAGR